MRFLVTFALVNEFAPWRDTARFREEKGGICEGVYRAEIQGADVTVLLTGVGAGRAGRAVSRLLRGDEQHEVLISSGLSGALHAEMKLGQVVAARGIACEPLQADARGGYLESSRPLVEFAEACDATVVKRFYTAGHVVASAEEKAILSQMADAVEMESFDVLLAGKEEGIPGIAIRAISDRADEDLPLDMSGILNEEGQVSVARVLGQAALRPQAVPGLMKLGHRSKRAAENLANFLNRYIGHIAERMSALEACGVNAGRSSAEIQ